MKNAIGKVLDKSSTKEFSFVATEYFKGEFVEIPINYSESKKVTIVGEIIYKEALNQYFEKPSSINYISEKDESITSWNLYIVKVKPIALVEDDVIKKIDFPPPPGVNVYIADKISITRALGLENTGISVGFLRQLKSLRIYLSEAMLCRTHFSILGRTGSGKSYFAKGLFKSIRDRKLIIFSPTDEYNEIAKDIDAQIISKKDFA
jgi:DNA helicase HerA-like ATPase